MTTSPKSPKEIVNEALQALEATYNEITTEVITPLERESWKPERRAELTPLFLDLAAIKLERSRLQMGLKSCSLEAFIGDIDKLIAQIKSARVTARLLFGEKGNQT